VDERTAIRRMKRGDISGLEVLVRRYEVKAVRVAYLITHDRALAEDVVQSAFLRAFDRIEQFDDSRPFAPYFMRVVANAAIQAARRAQRELSLDSPVRSGDSDTSTFADLLPDVGPGPDDQVEQDELRAAVWEALRQLSPEQRAAVVLRYYVGMSDQEMAEELDIAPGTVRWRLHAARKRLRVLLGRSGPVRDRPRGV
jgi:RNA polymerase sigma-70 factor, ECF subfamily